MIIIEENNILDTYEKILSFSWQTFSLILE
jgi:hypothetical protein